MQGDNVKGLSLGNDEWMDDGIIVYIVGCRSGSYHLKKQSEVIYLH